MAEDRERLDALARPHATVAGKIRALAAAGVPRADIARFLGKRYQHVRNVLEDDAHSSGGYVLGKADLSGVREEPARYDADAEDRRLIERRSPGVYWLRPRPDGSLVLPAEVAEALGIAGGDRVFATFRNGRLEIVSAEEAMEEALAIVRQHATPGVGVADEFLAERRAMWGEEDG